MNVLFTTCIISNKTHFSSIFCFIDEFELTRGSKEHRPNQENHFIPDVHKSIWTGLLTPFSILDPYRDGIYNNLNLCGITDTVLNYKTASTLGGKIIEKRVQCEIALIILHLRSFLVHQIDEIKQPFILLRTTGNPLKDPKLCLDLSMKQQTAGQDCCQNVRLAKTNADPYVCTAPLNILVIAHNHKLNLYSCF